MKQVSFQITRPRSARNVSVGHLQSPNHQITKSLIHRFPVPLLYALWFQIFIRTSILHKSECKHIRIAEDKSEAHGLTGQMADVPAAVP